VAAHEAARSATSVELRERRAAPAGARDAWIAFTMTTTAEVLAAMALAVREARR